MDTEGRDSGNGDVAPPENSADGSLSPFAFLTQKYPCFEICSFLRLRVPAFQSNERRKRRIHVSAKYPKVGSPPSHVCLKSPI